MKLMYVYVFLTISSFSRDIFAINYIIFTENESYGLIKIHFILHSMENHFYFIGVFGFPMILFIQFSFE